jgi:hypothetical protein
MLFINVLILKTFYLRFLFVRIEWKREKRGK